MAKLDNGTPDAVDLLTEQHGEVAELFQAIEEAEDPDEKQGLFEQIAEKLAIHARIEEQNFYPAVRGRKTEGMVLEAFIEHTSIKRLLSDLMDTDPEDLTFDAQIKVLKEQVEHHVEEEENDLFPAARKVLGRDELVALAQEMTALAADLEDEDPREAIRQEAANPPAIG